MKLIFFTCLSAFICLSVNAQQAHTYRVGYAQDLNIFQNILEQAHPSLHHYFPKEKWDTALSQAYKQCATVNDDRAFYKILSSIAYRVGDAHLSIQLDTILEEDIGRFVIPIAVIDGMMITTDHHKKLSRGSIIHSINGITVAELLQRLSKYSYTDGINKAHEGQKIAHNFERFLYYELGPQAQYTVNYFDYGDEEMYSCVIKGSSEDYMDEKYWDDYNDLEIEIDGNCAYSTNHLPKLSTEDDDVAVLTIPSFHIKPEAFRYFIYRHLRALENNAVQNLIIDLRDNPGGYVNNAMFLYACLAGRASSNFGDFSFTTNNQLPEKRYSTNVEEAQNVISNYRRNKALSSNDFIKPYFVFRGNTFILFNERSFSAASEFARLTTKDKNILTFGEESGGNAQLQTAGYFANYILPNSKISLRLGLISFATVDSSQTETYKGVVPNQVLESNLEDIYYENDQQMETLKALIFQNYTDHFREDDD